MVLTERWLPNVIALFELGDGYRGEVMELHLPQAECFSCNELS